MKLVECGLMCLQALVEGQRKQSGAYKAGQVAGKILPGVILKG